MQEPKARIGVVGGSGFIGNSLARYFSQDFDIEILDVKPPTSSLNRSVSFRYCDVRSYENLRNALSDVDLVFHTAIVQIPQINEDKRLAYEVNILGTQNVCEAVRSLPEAKGMILAGSWHAMGERELSGTVDEEFGFRPDKVEDRARLYSLSKMAQEAITRFYDEMSEKFYGIIRTGTVLGEGMPEKTAANIFIERGINGKTLTPYRHSMHRPMLYVDVGDVCTAYASLSRKILKSETGKSGGSRSHIVNIYYPSPVSVLELAEMVRDSVASCTGGKVNPRIEIIDQDLPVLFSREDKSRMRVDVSRAKKLLGITSLLSPEESIERIVRSRLGKGPNRSTSE